MNWRRILKLLAAMTPGLVVLALDVSAREQGPYIVFVLVAFWYALIANLSFWIISVATVAPWVAAALINGSATPSRLAAAVLAGIASAAVGVRARHQFGHGEVIELMPRPWYRARLGHVALVGGFLSAVALLGVPLIFASLRQDGENVALLTVRWWQALTFMMWMWSAPVLIRLRATMQRRFGTPSGLSLPETGMHLLLLAAIVVVHAAALVGVGVAMGDLLGYRGYWHRVTTTMVAYAPLDMLTYAALHTLWYLADRQREAKDAARREQELRATVVEARLAALQAQLKPHFLHNSLNAAIVLARAGDINRTALVIEQLSGMLRYVLDDSRPYVRLAEELDFVRSYLDVQQVRFGDQLRYEIRVSDVSAAIMIPRLILQPIVENAVEHGYTPSTAQRDVVVRADVIENRLQLAVDDAGPGPPAPDNTRRGIGLRHTQTRLETLYGAAGRLELVPREPRGTSALLTIALVPPAVHNA